MAHRAEMPTLAGLAPGVWQRGYIEVGSAFGLGQLTKAGGFERILRAGGAEARPELVRALVDRDRELPCWWRHRVRTRVSKRWVSSAAGSVVRPLCTGPG